jgi:hypothetical protein
MPSTNVEQTSYLTAAANSQQGTGHPDVTSKGEQTNDSLNLSQLTN